MLVSYFSIFMLASSANKTYLHLSETISLIYKLNRIGPKIEPCGTPQTIFSDSVLTMTQNVTHSKDLRNSPTHHVNHRISVTSIKYYRYFVQIRLSIVS